jgi:hypothetical protein
MHHVHGDPVPEKDVVFWQAQLRQLFGNAKSLAS